MGSFVASLCSFTLALVPVLAAQGGVVTPSHFAGAEGNGGDTIPLGINVSPVRYLQVHDDMAGSVRVIRGLAFRPMGTWSVSFPAYAVVLDAWASTATTSAGTPSSVFDNNHGNDKVQVISRRQVGFPGTQPGNLPGAFDYVVPFDGPFIFLGGGPLCVEMHKVSATNATLVYMDLASAVTPQLNPPLAVAHYGEGCRVTGRASPFSARGASVMNWPGLAGIIRVTGSQGPANDVALLAVGLRRTTAFGSIPLPFLLPGSPAAPSGACHLLTDVTLILAAGTTERGATTVDFPMQVGLDLHGMHLFSQLLVLDAAANPTGVVTSNGVVHHFVAPFGPVPGARVWAAGSLAQSGAIARNSLLVTRFWF